MSMGEAIVILVSAFAFSVATGVYLSWRISKRSPEDWCSPLFGCRCVACRAFARAEEDWVRDAMSTSRSGLRRHAD